MTIKGRLIPIFGIMLAALAFGFQLIAKEPLGPAISTAGHILWVYFWIVAIAYGLIFSLVGAIIFTGFCVAGAALAEAMKDNFNKAVSSMGLLLGLGGAAGISMIVLAFVIARITMLVMASSLIWHCYDQSTGALSEPRLYCGLAMLAVGTFIGQERFHTKAEDNQ